MNDFWKKKWQNYLLQTLMFLESNHTYADIYLSYADIWLYSLKNKMNSFVS